MPHFEPLSLRALRWVRRPPAISTLGASGSSTFRALPHRMPVAGWRRGVTGGFLDGDGDLDVVGTEAAHHPILADPATQYPHA